MKTNNPPFLQIENDTVVSVKKVNRKPMYENEMCRQVGLMATCNCCDRIIFEDENYKKQYVESGGYCRECNS